MRKVTQVLILLLANFTVFAQAEDLSKKIQNPIASLISVPFQNNTEFGYGADNRVLNTLNIQPVVPFGITSNMNLITRTIIPIKTTPVGANDTKSGLGDINMSLYLTPSKPSKVIWGLGLALGIPTATDAILGSQKWSAGPGVIILTQPGTWTIGALAQNTWSFAGSNTRADVNYFYSQIFVVKGLQNGWYVNSAPIITANWEATSGNQWTLPLGAGAGRLFTIGKLPVNVQVGNYTYVAKPDGWADSELRVQLVLLFP